MGKGLGLGYIAVPAYKGSLAEAEDACNQRLKAKKEKARKE